MGKQLTFTEDNIKKNPFDYPKLKLAKGETALLTYVENPYSEYVHNIQKPVLDERGNVLYRTAERADGTEYTVPKLTFVSNPICLGNEDVLAEDGIDPENCPVCARAAAGEKGFAPKRRFAMHVIRTNTRPGDFDPTEPAGHQLIIWAFTDTVFNKLFGFNKKFGLDKTALELGPCTDATFQKSDLNVHGSTVIDQKTIDAVFAEKNRSEDPTVFCGNRKSKQRIEDDLAVVDAEWAKSKGEAGDAVSNDLALKSGISALLDDGETPSASPKANDKDEEGWHVDPEDVAAAPAAALSMDDLPAPKANKAQTEPKAKAKVSDETNDLASILDNLG